MSPYSYSGFNTSNALSNLYTITSQASSYKMLSQYAIKSQMNLLSNTSTSSSNTSTSISSSAAKATAFLKQYDSKYESLKSTQKSLKETLNDSTSDTASIISATQKFITSYNEASSFLDDSSSSSTYQTNLLKNSLTNVATSHTSDLTSIGITRNTDGSLGLDEDKLRSALESSNTTSMHTLNRLVRQTDTHLSMASSASKVSLLKEQNALDTTSSTSTSVSQQNFDDFLKMAKNPLQLSNYYFKLSSLGLLMDIQL